MTDSPNVSDKLPSWLNSPLSPPNFARLVLVLIGLVWLVVGLTALGDPVGTAHRVGMDLEGRTAVFEFRGMYGGMSVAIAILHILGSTRRRWLWPAMTMATMLVAGLLGGRLISVAIDGLPGPVGFALAGIEIASLALLGFAMWRFREKPGAPAGAPAAGGATAPDKL